MLDEAERNIRKKLPRALSNFAEQMAQLNLEILEDLTLVESANWAAIIEAKDAPILAASFKANVDRILSLNINGIPIQTLA